MNDTKYNYKENRVDHESRKKAGRLHKVEARVKYRGVKYQRALESNKNILQ